MADIASRSGESAFSRYSEPSSPVRVSAGDSSGRISQGSGAILSALRGLASSREPASPLQILSNSAAAASSNLSNVNKEQKKESGGAGQIAFSSPEGGLDKDAPWKRLSIDTNGGGILKTGMSRPSNAKLNGGVHVGSVSRSGAGSKPGSAISGASTAIPGSASTRANASHSTGKKENENTDTKFRGAWTPDEDARLIEIVRQRGPNGWTTIATELNTGRNGRQCRERWSNQINPDLKRTGWTDEEDELILRLHKEVGNKWATIAKQLPGRTDNMVKNRFNGSLLPRTTRPESQRKGATTKKPKPGQSRGKAIASAPPAVGQGGGVGGPQQDLLVGGVAPSTGKKRRSRASKGSSGDSELTPPHAKEAKTGSGASKSKKSGNKKRAGPASSKRKGNRAANTAVDEGLVNACLSDGNSLLNSDSMQRLTTAAAAVEMLEGQNSNHSNSSVANPDSLQMVSNSFHNLTRGVLDFNSPAIQKTPLKRNFVPNSGASTSTAGLRGLSHFADILAGRSSSSLSFSAESSPNTKQRETSSPFLPLQMTPNRFADMLGTARSTGDITPAAVRNLSENFSTGMVDRELASASAKKRARAANAQDSETPMSMVGSECGPIGGVGMLTRSSSRKRQAFGKAKNERPESPTSDVEAENAAAAQAAGRSAATLAMLMKTPTSVSAGQTSGSSARVLRNASSSEASIDPDEPMGMMATPSKAAAMSSPSIISMLTHIKNNLGSAQRGQGPAPTPTPGISSFQELKLESQQKLTPSAQAGSSQNTKRQGRRAPTDKSGAMEICTDDVAAQSRSGFEGEQILTPTASSAMAVLSEVAAVSSLPREISETSNSLLSAPGGPMGLLPSSANGNGLPFGGSESNSNMSSAALLQRLLNNTPSGTGSLSGDSSTTGRTSANTTTSAASEAVATTTTTTTTTTAPAAKTPTTRPQESRSAQDQSSQGRTRSSRSRRSRRTSPASTPVVQAEAASRTKSSIVTPDHQAQSSNSHATPNNTLWGVATKPCACRRSKCLKLYCTCFSSALHCGPTCDCHECSNVQGDPLWQAAVAAQPPGVVDGSPRDAGCRCRNSGCIKKYCECYRNGKMCGPKCGCDNCGNTPDKARSTTYDQEEVKGEDVEL